jgi:hypothetical protein
LSLPEEVDPVVEIFLGELLAMDATRILSQVKIASPCAARWSQMKGDDRVRFCDQCQLQVYNLSALSAAEALAVVTKSEARTCVRFHRRRDGTMLTADCPVGAKTARRRRVLRIASAAALGLTSLFGGTTLLAKSVESSPHRSENPFREFVDWVRIQLGFRGPMMMGRPVMGGIMPIPVPPSVEADESLQDARECVSSSGSDLCPIEG